MRQVLLVELLEQHQGKNAGHANADGSDVEIMDVRHGLDPVNNGTVRIIILIRTIAIH